MAAGCKLDVWLVAFALIYLTFFLDNVLLTVLVPIIPDWVSGESLELWSREGAPLARVLNSTVRGGGGGGGGGGWAQASVGAVLSAKAAAQLTAARGAARAVRRRGAAAVLRGGTALLLGAALALAGCAHGAGGRGPAWGAALAAGAARAVQGAGAALASVAGLALAGGAPRPRVGALLGAVALGVLLGYPAGGLLAARAPAAPFLLAAAALALDLVMQHLFLKDEEFDSVVQFGLQVHASVAQDACKSALFKSSKEIGLTPFYAAAQKTCETTAAEDEDAEEEEEEEGAGYMVACCGCVLLSTSVMAALEPCLPLWMERAWEAPPQRWQRGLVFVPDSAAYLLAATLLGGAARRWGCERVALAGQACVGVGALLVPLARSAAALAVPHAALGAGLGAVDAALVPAVLGRARGSAGRAACAARLQAAAAAAYALGPAAGGALAALAGFDTALRALGVANLLYAAHLARVLRRHPLSVQWGAPPAAPGSAAEDSSGDTPDAAPDQRVQALKQYSTFQ